MKSEKSIKQLIKKFYVTTSPNMDERVRNDILEIVRRTKHIKSFNTHTGVWSVITGGKTAKLAVAVAVVVMTILCINYFGVFIGKTSVAFADVVRPFLAARTATFTITFEGPNDQPSFSVKGMFAEPGRMRNEGMGEFEVVQIIDMQKGEVVSLMPKEKIAMVFEISNMSIEKQREANMFFEIRRQLQQAQDANDGSVEFLGECQIDGIAADGYLLKEELGIEMTFWMDLDSLLPVRIEYDMSEMLGQQQKIIMSDFEFNVELDESLFSLEIPEDYTVKTMQIDASEPVEKDLVEMFRLWADVTDGKFPSDLSFKKNVIAEFSEALTKDLFKREEQEQQYPEEKENLYKLLDEIKPELTQLQEIIRDGKTETDLHLLGDSIKKHLKELREYKEQQEEAEQQYVDELISRHKNSSDNVSNEVQTMQEKMTPIARGLVFVQKLPADSDWHYAGKGVEYGDGNTPIFWYKPEGLGICRIIYGDLTIKDVDLSRQPKAPEVSSSEMPENADDSEQPPSVGRSLKDLLIAGEKDFVRALGIWTDFMDGRFPSSLDITDLVMDFHDYQRERLSKNEKRPSYGKQIAEMRQDMISIVDEVGRYISHDFMFVGTLDADSDWHYAGKGINVGDSDKAIFWYKPKGSNRYRVIYADLTIGQTTADQLPKCPDKTQGYKDLHKEKLNRVVPPSEPAAVEILEKVQKTYDSLDSYRSVCEVVTDFNTALIFDVNNFPDLTQNEIERLQQNAEFKKIFNESYVTNTSLTMTLARPQLYYIQWTEPYIKGSGSNYTGDSVGCLWSDGESYYGIKRGKKKVYKHFYLGAGPWDSSETIPTIFYDRINNTLKLLKGLVKEEDDTVENELCYVISGLHHNKTVRRLWISKERLLILKKEREINFEGRTYIRGKWQIKKILKAMGEEITPEAIELMQERIKEGFAKKKITKGLVIETQRNIIINEPVSVEELQPPTSIKSNEE